MTSKREREEPVSITYGSIVPGLQSLIHKSTHRTHSGEIVDAADQDPVLDGCINDEATLEASIWEVARVDYLLHHHLVNRSEILDSFGLLPGMKKHQHLDKQLSLKQSQWKGAILNRFFLPHVQELVRKFCVANPWRSFGSLPGNERWQMWLNAYDADPKRMATSMFKPVIGVLDTSNAFSRNLEEEEDRTRMRAVRIMMRNKYLFGCEITYAHRIAVDKKA
jgi:hypothetical protein